MDREIVLDFTEVRSLWELHEHLKEAFHLPDYYGRNMDALWDCLYCAFAVPTTIVLKNIDRLPAEMKEAGDILRALFGELEKRDENVTIKEE